KAPNRRPHCWPLSCAQGSGRSLHRYPVRRSLGTAGAVCWRFISGSVARYNLLIIRYYFFHYRVKTVLNFACVEVAARWRGQPKLARQFSESASTCVFLSSKMSLEFRNSSKLRWSAPSLPWTLCGCGPKHEKHWQTLLTMPQSSISGFPTVTG